MVNDPDQAIADAAAARDAGADLVELRIDGFVTGPADADELRREHDDVVRLIADCPLPCIITCRSAIEGGEYDGPEEARIALYERLGTAFGTLPDGRSESPPRYLDLEHAVYSRSANIRQKINLAVDHPEQIRDLRTALILSMHDHQTRPADLTRRLLAMRTHPAARIIKVAWRARSIRDNLELFDILSERDRPTIALGMGEFGLMSRLLAPKFGGFLTFASLRRESITAPGQPTIAELLNTYRFRAIKPSTRIYGLIAWPVSHSISPRIHNAAFDELQHDGVYVPMPVAEGFESFKATLLDLLHHPRLDLTGVSVSIPHKENLARLAREQNWHMDAISTAAGSANTLFARRDARSALSAISIHNTDAPALLDSIETSLGPVTDMDIAILGAGGLGRVAAFALASAGARITVYNRDEARAQAVARDITRAGRDAQPASPPTFAAWPVLAASAHDVYINCTPIGMTGGPAPDASPVNPAEIAARNPRAAFFDCVYAPIMTPMLSQAVAAGCRIITGLDMFARQAEGQARLWLGDVPSDLYARLVREATDQQDPNHER